MSRRARDEGRARAAWRVGLLAAWGLAAWGLAAWGLAAPAAAQPVGGVLMRGATGNLVCDPGPFAVGATTCDTVACAPGRECVELAVAGAVCVDAQNELVCVQGDCDQCPMMPDGRDPEACRPGTALGGVEHALCFYDGDLVCLAEASFSELFLCLPSVPLDPSTALADCDGDGFSNTEDECLCEHAPDPAGGGCLDTDLDGGVDAGPPDAGDEEQDAGAEDDAGSRDAGSIDAGSIDAGRPLDGGRRDAGPRPGTDGGPVDAPPSFRGGGGCVCRASPSSAPAGRSAWLAVAMIGLALAGRRGLRPPRA